MNGKLFANNLLFSKNNLFSLRILFLIILSFALIGCGSSRKYKTEVLSSDQTLNLQGKTYGLFPLDMDKANKLETQILTNQIIDELTKKGMVFSKRESGKPNYIFLFDYATDMGIDAPWEHVFLLQAFQVSENNVNQTYKGKIYIDSSERNPIKPLSQPVQKLLNSFPKEIN